MGWNLIEELKPAEDEDSAFFFFFFSWGLHGKLLAPFLGPPSKAPPSIRVPGILPLAGLPRGWISIGTYMEPCFCQRAASLVSCWFPVYANRALLSRLPSLLPRSGGHRQTRQGLLCGDRLGSDPQAKRNPKSDPHRHHHGRVREHHHERSQ